MAINQIYGPNYWAGVEIPASGKYQAKTGATTVAVARVVTVVDQTGAEVNLGGTGTTAPQVQGAAAQASTTTINPVDVGGRFNATPTALTEGQRTVFQTTTRGSLRVSLYDTGATPVGVAAATVAAQVSAGSVGIDSRSYQYVSDGVGWAAKTLPTTASRIPSAANSTNPTVAKASRGALHRVNGYNSTATVTYIKFYNRTTAPTVGTDTVVLTLAIPPSAVFDFNLDGMLFTTGIAYGLTTDAADAGTTAVAAGSILGLNVVYA